MYYVYVLKSDGQDWRYIGCTSDLRERFRQHSGGQVKSTKGKRPLTLIYYEAYQNGTLARKREIELKTKSQQKEILYRRINGEVA